MLRRRKVAALLLLLASGLMAGFAEEPGLEVMSYNIRYDNPSDGPNRWPQRKENVVALIRDVNPDVLGTQEVLHHQGEFLKSALTDYASVGVGRDDGKEKGEMCTIFYRAARFDLLDAGHFWLSTTPDTVGSRGWDARIPRMATWVKLRDKKVETDVPLFVLNTHFDHRGVQAREEAAKLIVQRVAVLAKGCAVVLMGDFNVGEGSRPYKTIFDPQALRLQDTFRAVVPARTPDEGTFTGWQSAENRARIDWLGCSDHFGVVDAAIRRDKIAGRWPSDHFAVTARLIRIR